MTNCLSIQLIIDNTHFFNQQSIIIIKISRKEGYQMDINSTIEIQNGIIKMLLDKIENLEAEVTKLRNLADNTSNEDGRQLKDEVAKINYMIFGDEYTPSDYHAEH